MAINVIMPKQGLQMTEGTITEWLVKEGDSIKEGDPIFSIETDKTTIQIDAKASGKLLKILVQEGDTVPVAETVAIIGEANEKIKEVEKVKEVKEIIEERIFSTPRARMVAAEKNIDILKVSGSGPSGLIIEKDIPISKATPLAKKIAADKNIQIDKIQGTGARNKVTKEDVLNSSSSSDKIIPFSGMRKVIADHMVESLHTAAQATHNIKVDMSEAEKLKNTFKLAEKRVSYSNIISFAVCRALKDYPIMNSEITNEGILIKNDINLGIAVAIDKGLIVPVIKNANSMSIEEIGAETLRLATLAKNGQLKPEEYKGGSFTISNLGMFGLSSFTAIINPPESGILAVGNIEKTPVVVNDAVVVRPIMILTLTYDHRVVDGAPAAEFLAKIKLYLENPYLLLWGIK